MAWNKYYIVVTNQPDIQLSEVISKLNLTGYKPFDKVPFGATNKSKDLFIGKFKNTLVIANPDLTYAFFEETPGEIENAFVKAFPDSEIAALAENSTVGEFGFCLIENGRRIRLKHGSDNEIYIDQGKMLPEENEIRNGHIFDPEELEEMREEMDEEEVMDVVAFEAAWRVPSALSKRYFGVTLESLGKSDLEMMRYKES